MLELGSLCAAEKAIWFNRLTKAQLEARRQWDEQALDEAGNPTLFDDTLISSVSPQINTGGSTTPNVPTTPVRKSHSRSTSSISVTSVLAAATGGASSSLSSASLASASSNSPFVAQQDEPLPAMPSDPSLLLASSNPQFALSSAGGSNGNSGSATVPSISNRHRFSTTASSLLGRTPSAQRAAVDLRLADVFSEECLAARAQAAREAIEADETAGQRRLRTISGPKRSMTAGLSSAASSKTLSARDRRRMSSFELEMGRSSIGDLRGGQGSDAFGVGAAGLSLYQRSGEDLNQLGLVTALTTPERKWANAIRKTKSAGSRSRPALPEIDTALAEAMNQKHRTSGGEKQAPLTATGSSSGSWRAKAETLRRVASHSSLDGGRRSLSAIPPASSGRVGLAPSAVGVGGGGTVDVERNNSVSSTTSSNGTATNSSSSHSHGLHLLETPPSSIPPSPDLCALEIVDSPFVPHSTSSSTSSLKPSLSTKSSSSSSSRWTAHALQDGVSSVFRMKRRKSTLGLTPLVDADFETQPQQQSQRRDERPKPPPHVRSTTSTSSHSASSSHTSNSEAAATSSSNTAGAKLSRRSSTLGGYLQKRVQSSPTLTGFFHSALGSTSSPHLPLAITSAPASTVALDSTTGSGSTSPSSGSSATFHTPTTSLPGTPELPSGAELVPLTTTASPSQPTVTAVPKTLQQTTPRSGRTKGGAAALVASKVGRTVSSTFQSMARQRSSDGSGSPSSSSSSGASSLNSGTINSRRFHFSMTPLS